MIKSIVPVSQIRKLRLWEDDCSGFHSWEVWILASDSVVCLCSQLSSWPASLTQPLSFHSTTLGKQSFRGLLRVHRLNQDSGEVNKCDLYETLPLSCNILGPVQRSLLTSQPFPNASSVFPPGYRGQWWATSVIQMQADTIFLSYKNGSRRTRSGKTRAYPSWHCLLGCPRSSGHCQSFADSK